LSGKIFGNKNYFPEKFAGPVSMLTPETPVFPAGFPGDQTGKFLRSKISEPGIFWT